MSGFGTILVVDGDDTLRKGCRDLLERTGCLVFESPGATHARMFLGTITPTVVLLEVSLPDQSGLEVLRFVKHNRALHEVPVVLMSASAALPEGSDLATSVLRKPFTPEQLFAAVRAACGGTYPASVGPADTAQ
jgi:DNA-binding response OmpR family regulator